MATVNAVLRPATNRRGEQPIYVRISHKGKTNYKSVGVSVKPKFWDEKNHRVRPNDYYDADSINKIISDQVKDARDTLYALKATGKSVSAVKIKSKLTGENETDFISLGKKFAERKASVNERTGMRYRAIVAKVEEFSKGSLYLEDITYGWLKDFQDWLTLEKKNNYSTVHSNFRGIRAIVNDAIKADLLTLDKNPFLKFRMERPKPKKTKLNKSEINALKALDTFTSDLQEISRDAFLFSFYTCGMRFTDLCLLKWENIEGDKVKYLVSKTKEYLSVELVPEALDILEKYRAYGSVKNEAFYTSKKFTNTLIPDQLTHESVKPLIFPLLEDADQTVSEKKLISRIGSANAKVNSALKLVAKNAGISKPVSFHVARHSFANIANTTGMPFNVIQSTLNHKSAKTTEAYLNSLESEVVNQSVRDFFGGLRDE